MSSSRDMIGIFGSVSFGCLLVKSLSPTCVPHKSKETPRYYVCARIYKEENARRRAPRSGTWTCSAGASKVYTWCSFLGTFSSELCSWEATYPISRVHATNTVKAFMVDGGCRLCFLSVCLFSVDHTRTGSLALIKKKKRVDESTNILYI